MKKPFLSLVLTFLSTNCLAKIERIFMKNDLKQKTLNMILEAQTKKQHLSYISRDIKSVINRNRKLKKKSLI